MTKFVNTSILSKWYVTCDFIGNSSLVVDLDFLTLTILVGLKGDGGADNGGGFEITEEDWHWSLVDGDVVVRMNIDRDSLVLGRRWRSRHFLHAQWVRCFRHGLLLVFLVD